MTAEFNSHQSEAIKPGSDRSFGLVVGGILAALGLYLWLSGSDRFLWLLAPGFTLLLVGWIRPQLLHVLNVAWTKLGLLLGSIVAPIVMLLVYVISIVPIGLLLRLSGKDLLRLRKADAADSYWIGREPPGPPPESLKDQF